MIEIEDKAMWYYKTDFLTVGQVKKCMSSMNLQANNLSLAKKWDLIAARYQATRVRGPGYQSKPAD
jgi:hypothetical protein